MSKIDLYAHFKSKQGLLLPTIEATRVNKASICRIRLLIRATSRALPRESKEEP